MQTKTKVISVTGLVVGSVVFGMILASNLDLGRSASAQKQPASAQAAAAAPPVTARPQPSLLLPSFADIAEQVMPAVVSVTTTEIVKANDRRRQNPFGTGEGFDFFFPDRRRGEDEEDRKEVSGGSGFVIESEGFILTNNHVIEGADRVVVKLGDDEYTAKVVGRDPASDLALIKIDGSKPFPVVR
ncbi:MAG: trypsin-like peptidase domain-containing protein, partial [Acidobacteria bacterium]|nr:trypsin-like peptidase domain-containing protein [Acidobacteriota bacterium]